MVGKHARESSELKMLIKRTQGNLSETFYGLQTNYK